VLHHGDRYQKVRTYIQGDGPSTSYLACQVFVDARTYWLNPSSAKEPKFATVLVGEFEERFVVHEQLLTHNSKFFNHALTEPFKEAKEKLVRLSDTQPDTFEFFVHWLYYQRFPDASKGDDEELVQSWEADAKHLLITNIIRIYILGGVRIIPALQQQALDYLYRLLTSGYPSKMPTMHDLKLAFDSLKTDDPLCRLLINTDIYYNLIKLYKGLTLLEDYVRAVACRATQIIEDISSGSIVTTNLQPKLCDYHEHEIITEE
jgi:hypothetical protein